MDNVILDILSRCKSGGISITLQNENLKVASKSRTPDLDLIKLIKQYKNELVDYLTKLEVIKENSIFEKITIAPFDRNEVAPLPVSFSQKRLWFIDQLDKGNAQYNIPGGLLLKGELDIDKLRKSFTYIVNRHEVIRTVYDTVNQGVIPKILPIDLIDLPIENLSTLSDKDQQERIQLELKKEATTGFDLSKDLMLRIRLLTLSENSHVLLFCMHHIASDGWSMGILIKELGEIYNNLVAGKQIKLPSLPIQYADYAYWQQHYLQGIVLSKYKNYWDKQLAGIPVMHELPLDFSRPQIQQGKGSSIHQVIAKDVAVKLQKLAHHYDCTLFMVLQSAFSVFLSRHSNREDIVMGTPIANREQKEVAGLIGFFVNTLVLRSDLSGNPTFTELLTRNKTMLLEAYAHQQMPFEQLVEVLQPERSMSHSPLFQVMFALQNNEQSALELSGLTLSGIEGTVETSKFDLSLNISETEEGLFCNWEYDTCLFTSLTIQHFITRFELLLEGIVFDATTNIHNLPILSQKERVKLHSWNETQVDYPSDQCVHELIEEQALLHPDNTAVVFENETLTYRELNEKANQLAYYLKEEKGIKPDVLVGICLHKSIELAISILGILKAGGAYVPLDPDYPASRLQHMITDASLKTVITSRDIIEKNNVNFDAETVLDCSSFEETLSKYSIENIDSQSIGLKPFHLAYVIYTSGSTGKPKGVMIEHRHLINMAQFFSKQFGFKPTVRALQFASFNFDVSVEEIFSSWCSGATLVFRNNTCLTSAANFWKFCTTQNINLIDLPTAFFHLLLDSDLSLIPSGLKTIIVGGEALNTNKLKAWFNNKQTLPKLYNTYGPTEATATTTSHEVTGLDETIGRVIQNLQGYVLDQFGNSVPIGVAGELCIGGAGVARGYLNRAELTAERFISHSFPNNYSEKLYKSGDLVKFLPDGNLAFLGRIDQQIKLRGFRIELGEIEEVLSNHDHVKDAIVTLFEENFLVGYVAVGTREDNLNDLTESILSLAKRDLPAYMVPSFILPLEKLPLTPNGKIDRKALPSPKVSDLQKTYTPPSTAKEKQLAAIWSELLDVKKIGIHDNFFHMGGHSLMIMQLAGHLKSHGLQVSAQEVFNNPTLGELAKKLAPYQDDYVVPTNLITAATTEITPQLLPLVENITESSLQQLVSDIPGGVSNIEDIYPLAPLQEGIFFHHQMQENQKDPYVQSTIISFDTSVQRERFTEALQAIVNRHDVLRTSYHWDNLPEPLQVVQRKATLPISTFKVEPNEGETLADALQREVDQGSFSMDLRQAPLIHTHIFDDKDKEQYFLVLSDHHIIMDHIGLEQIVKEIALYYSGNFSTLPAPIQYRNFVDRVKRLRANTDYLSYFKSRFSSIDQPTLSYGFSNVNLDGSKVLESKQRLSHSQSLEIREQCKKSTISPAALFHAAWGIVVGRTSNLKDKVVFGTVLSGRIGSTDAGNSLGLYINTLPLALEIKGTVKEYVSHVYQEISGLVDYEQVSLSEIKKLTKLKEGHIPLFNTIINYRYSMTDTGMSTEEQQGLESSGISILKAQERTNFPLTLAVDDYGDEFGLTVKVTNQIGVSAEIILDYIEHVALELVEVLGKESTIPVSELTMTSSNERELINTWKDQAISVPPTAHYIHELFESQVAQNPDKVAIIFEEKALTYGILNAQSNQLAHYLREVYAVSADDKIGIYITDPIQTQIAILAILKSGACYVPLDPTFPTSRINFIVEDAALTTVLTSVENRASLPAISLMDYCVLDEEKTLRAIQSHQECNIELTAQKESSRLAYVIYTSGSTGKPKGVLIEHRNIIDYVQGLITRLKLDKASYNFALMSTVAADLGLTINYGSLATGGELHLFTKSQLTEGEYLTQYFNDHQIDIMKIVPSHWKALSGTGNLLLPEKLLMFGGDILSLDIIKRIQSTRPSLDIYNHYGPTETTVGKLLYKIPNNASSEEIPIGKVFSDSTIYVLDEQRGEVPIGVPGELYIGGTGVARGYLNRPDLTAERFIQHPFTNNPLDKLYRTGDLVKYQPDGNIVFLGRIDHQIKLRGYRIELGEVAEVISRHPLIKDAVVTLHNKSHLVGYVSVSAIDELSEDFVSEVLLQAKSELPNYMVPSFIVPMNELPLTTNGKINRKALPAPNTADRQENYTAPTTNTECTLATIWEEILDIEKVGLHDNFFHLGGHSLIVLKLVSELKKIGFTLSAQDIFKQPLLSTMAKLIDENKKVDKAIDREIIIHMNHETEGKPIFLLHEISGDAFQYNTLVNHLNIKAPIYCLDASGIDINKSFLQSIESLATFYIKEIQRKQPTGPYRLLGWSFGGQLAFEISKQLSGMDQEVEFVGLIDTDPSDYSQEMHDEERVKNLLKALITEIGYEGTVQTAHIEKALTFNDKGVISLKTDSIYREQAQLFFKEMSDQGLNEQELLRRLTLANILANAANNYILQKFQLPIYYYSADHRVGNNHGIIDRDVIAEAKMILGNNISAKLIEDSSHQSIVKNPQYAKELGASISETLSKMDQKEKITIDTSAKVHQPIISFQKGEIGYTPLYCVPGAGGAIGGLIQMANYFNHTMPIYGIIPRGLENDIVPHTTVEAAAKYYIEKMCLSSTNIPCNLLGHSYGGWVVIEMANQLVKMGHTVESVILLDASSPKTSLDEKNSKTKLFTLSRLIELFELQSSKKFNVEINEMVNWSEKKRIETVLSNMKDMKIMPKTTHFDDIRRMVQLFSINANTFYTPSRKYEGKVLLVQAPDDAQQPVNDKNQLGWSNYLSNMNIIKATGNHMSMLMPPYVNDLVMNIESFMERNHKREHLGI